MRNDNKVEYKKKNKKEKQKKTLMPRHIYTHIHERIIYETKISLSKITIQFIVFTSVSVILITCAD